MHSGVLQWAEAVLTPDLVSGKRVLEVGSQDYNGTVRSLIESLDPLEYVGIDISDGPGVDKVLGAENLLSTFGPKRWDLVVSTEMLEHCLLWKDAIYQMKESLVDGGWLVLTTRSPGYPQHGYPEDYWRFSEQAMRLILADLIDVEVISDPGFLTTEEDVGFPIGVFASQPGVFAIGMRMGEVVAPEGWGVETAPGWSFKTDDDPSLFDPLMREIEAHSLLKVDIGSGSEREDMTWKTVDKYMPADYTADMWNLPFEDESVDAIRSSHALEHVGRRLVIPTLTEWYRVLKVGGTLDLLVPDLDYIAQLWLESAVLPWDKGSHVLGWVFGNQMHEGEYHKTGWNVAGLRADVESVGFIVKTAESIWTDKYNQNSIEIEATK